MSQHTKHHKDNIQILHSVYDFNTDSIRTHLTQDHQFVVSLNDKEDSVLAVAKSDSLNPGDEKPCEGFKSALLYIFSGKAEVFVSPVDDGDKWISIGSTNADSGGTGAPAPHCAAMSIIAKRIKLVADQEAYLLLQG